LNVDTKLFGGGVVVLGVRFLRLWSQSLSPLAGTAGAGGSHHQIFNPVPRIGREIGIFDCQSRQGRWS
jgi:hypothetical protein